MKNMNFDRIKKYAQSYFMSILFVIVSIISVSYAWIAYYNQTDSSVEIGIKSWNIDIKRGDTILSNQFDVNLPDFAPGMKDYHDTITITNTGDVVAKISYSVTNLRIFDQTYNVTSQTDLERLSQDYPWVISMIVDTNYLEPTQTTNFNLLVMWPLDSLNNSVDTQYGKKAYDFIKIENETKESNPDYVIRSCISFTISLNIEQYISDDNSVDDNRFLFNNALSYSSNGSSCSGSSCNDFYLLKKTIKNDSNFIAMRDYNTFATDIYHSDSNNVNTKYVLSLISRDLYDTKIVIPNASDRIIGYVTDDTLLQNILDKVANNNGYISFSPSIYYYFDSSTCIWTDLNYGSTDKKYAIKKVDDSIILYGESTTTSCYSVKQFTINK